MSSAKIFAIVAGFLFLFFMAGEYLYSWSKPEYVLWLLLGQWISGVLFGSWMEQAIQRMSGKANSQQPHTERASRATANDHEGT